MQFYLIPLTFAPKIYFYYLFCPSTHFITIECAKLIHVSADTISASDVLPLVKQRYFLKIIQQILSNVRITIN